MTTFNGTVAPETSHLIGPSRAAVRCVADDAGALWLRASEVDAYHQAHPRMDSKHLAPHPTPRWKDRWLEFELAMTLRLQKGHQNYGDKSFSRDPAELLREIQEELLDISGWGYIVWCRMNDMLGALDESDK